jgi:hypothetical protein
MHAAAAGADAGLVDRSRAAYESLDALEKSRASDGTFSAASVSPFQRPSLQLGSAPVSSQAAC